MIAKIPFFAPLLAINALIAFGSLSFSFAVVHFVISVKTPIKPASSPSVIPKYSTNVFPSSFRPLYLSRKMAITISKSSIVWDKNCSSGGGIGVPTSSSKYLIPSLMAA
ncbi:hypothetical protein COY07_00835 [Candidatus Peregrinibacteria bacterium CG_4_10_14_0_2_um_filter_43_11]|nr:MAG: hypothetical protein COY07_00835 [Candidatus Peregrinibacteria bacterium CG_4_10_14_0_2_um_filter_43_11]